MSKVSAITRITSRIGLVLQKNAPEILTYTGIVGGVTAAVLGAQATLKVEPLLNELAEDRENINTMVKSGAYTDKADQLRRDRAYVTTKGFLSIAKAYAPSILLGIASVGAILGGHNILRKRNAALVAAYTTLERSFKAYRKRVAEEFGDDIEKRLADGRKAKAEDYEPTEEDYQDDAGVGLQHPYVRYFDEGSSQWSRTAEYNKVFLISTQNYFNDILKMRGHVFLNEVLDRLGFAHSQVGAIVGWVYDGDGDNYIDFGFDNEEDRGSRAFVNEFERSVRLEFNVDGVIYNLIKE